MHLGNSAADAVVHGYVFIGSEEVFDGVVGIAMRGDEIDGHVIRRGVLQEVRHPGGSGGRRSTDAQARAYSLERTCGVSIQIEVGLLAGNTIPEIDIRLVPDLEIP